MDERGRSEKGYHQPEVTSTAHSSAAHGVAAAAAVVSRPPPTTPSVPSTGAVNAAGTAVPVTYSATGAAVGNPHPPPQGKDVNVVVVVGAVNSGVGSNPTSINNNPTNPVLVSAGTTDTASSSAIAGWEKGEFIRRIVEWLIDYINKAYRS